MNVINLKYGKENFGKEIKGYRGGEFLVIGKAIVGDYENKIDYRHIDLLHKLIPVMGDQYFAVYNHKGHLFATRNVTPMMLIKAGFEGGRGFTVGKYCNEEYSGDFWDYEYGDDRDHIEIVGGE